MDEPFVRQDEEKGPLQRSGGGPTVHLLSHSKYKLSHAFRKYLHPKKENSLTAEELCYLGVEFVNKCKLLYCLMHQLFIVNGDPGARNSVDWIFIGQEPLQQLGWSGEFSSRMRVFFVF